MVNDDSKFRRLFRAIFGKRHEEPPPGMWAKVEKRIARMNAQHKAVEAARERNKAARS